MDEYSPKRHDIAQLKFLCENLYDEGIATWETVTMGGSTIRRPPSTCSLMS